ncbi:MAG: metallopeptidase family protein [Actinomycetaceae bacterium]|nr:metallopeptidase family protein [Actinomycetaceae bacterium]
MPRSIIPNRSHARRRDRHGRGLRGPVIPFTAPAWRTRADMFDDVIAADLAEFKRHLGEEMDHIDYGVLDVPDSQPAPWEQGVPLARFLPFEKPAKITGRIVFYRMPILQAARRTSMPQVFIHDVVTQQLASALGREPEDIDYLF